MSKHDIDEQRDTATRQISFSLAGALRGVKRTIPIALSDCAVGIVFGVLAHQAKFSILQSLLMSTLVFAGAAQFVALTFWTVAPLPVATIILTTFIINLRHLLMGASLRPWFARLSALKIYTSAIFIVDESWALTITDFSEGGRDGAFLLGSGLTLLIAWTGGTVIGQTAGSIIRDPAQWGLDFAFTAVFVALLVGMWKGKSNILPWAVAAIVAVAAAHWLPGKWYILSGGLAGSITGAITNAK